MQPKKCSSRQKNCRDNRQGKCGATAHVSFETHPPDKKLTVHFSSYNLFLRAARFATRIRSEETEYQNSRLSCSSGRGCARIGYRATLRATFCGDGSTRNALRRDRRRRIHRLKHGGRTC